MRGKVAKAIRRKVKKELPFLSPEMAQRFVDNLKKDYKNWRQGGNR